MAKASVKKSAPATDTKPSIQVATRKPTAADMLASLAGKGTVAAPKKKAGGERPELDMDDELQQTFAEYAPTKVLADVFVNKAEALKQEVNAGAFESWVTSLWKQKSQPKNPALRARNEQGKVDCEAMFVVQNRFSVQIPDPARPLESTVELLESLGVSRAADLVAEELDASPQIGLRPFNELINGHYEEKEFVEATDEEKAVGEKIMTLIMQELTDEEKALVLKTTPKCVVKKGFLERVSGYCGTRDELMAVMQVFKPCIQNKGAKFGVSDTEMERTNRLLEKARELLGDANLDADDED